MSGKECYHFTYLNRAKSINNTGLEPRLEENSEVIKDSDPKVSFSDGRIGATGLFANFYRIYTDIKEGKRDNDKTDPELAQKVKDSNSFEEFLGEGIYLMFDGTNIENTGGNKGHINIFDAGTKEKISPEDLKVCMLRNNNTGEVSYSKYDFIHYLMVNLTQDDFLQMPNEIQKDIAYYFECHTGEMDKFKTGNYDVEIMSIEKFCKQYEKDIDIDLEKYQLNKDKISSIAKQEDVARESENAEQIIKEAYIESEITKEDTNLTL